MSSLDKRNALRADAAEAEMEEFLVEGRNMGYHEPAPIVSKDTEISLDGSGYRRTYGGAVPDE